MTFDAVGRLVGGLPPSAYRHREWWANNGHSHALAWEEARCRVTELDLRGQRVVFQRLGERVERKPVADPAPADPSSWARADVVAVNVTFRWLAAGAIRLDSLGKPQFPDLPPEPGIYRLMFDPLPGDTRPRVYVGETDNLRRRLSGNYRNPGPSQQTSLRVNALLREHLSRGGVITLSAALEVSAGSSDAAPAPLDLTRKAGRLLAENAALLALRSVDAVDIENLG